MHTHELVDEVEIIGPLAVHLNDDSINDRQLWFRIVRTVHGYQSEVGVWLDDCFPPQAALAPCLGATRVGHVKRPWVA